MQPSQATILFKAGLVGKAAIYRSPRAVGHYTRGTFAGFVTVLFGKEAICVKLACQLRGDPACEFVVLPREV